MDHRPERFPDNTILRYKRVDVYGSKRSGAISVFCEGKFDREIVKFEFFANDRELLFIFQGDLDVSYGAPIDNELACIMLKAKEASVFYFDKASEDAMPLGAVKVPFKVIYD